MTLGIERLTYLACRIIVLLHSFFVIRKRQMGKEVN